MPQKALRRGWFIHCQDLAHLKCISVLFELALSAISAI